MSVQVPTYLQDRALRIFVRRCSGKEPAIVSGGAMTQALFRFIGRAGVDGASATPLGRVAGHQDA